MSSIYHAADFAFLAVGGMLIEIYGTSPFSGLQASRYVMQHSYHRMQVGTRNTTAFKLQNEEGVSDGALRKQGKQEASYPIPISSFLTPHSSIHPLVFAMPSLHVGSKNARYTAGSGIEGFRFNFYV